MMDRSLTTQLFRQLFTHRTCSVLRYSIPSTAAPSSTRYKSTNTDTTATFSPFSAYKDGKSWQHRHRFFKDGPPPGSKKYPIVTADKLRDRTNRPKRVKMLLRDFIEDSLYNPNYGYFPKQAVIFSPEKPFDFRSMRNSWEFDRQFYRAYQQFEDGLDAVAVNPLRQMWHTPVELFQPYFGESIARYMATNYRLSNYSYTDLVVYEMGAGNGTLMLNILDYLRAHHPDVYIRTQYRVIEISSALANIQTNALLRTIESRGHLDRVTIINKSIFDWDTYVSTPCFFLALEVFDNFAHDAIRYDPQTLAALQTRVVIDGQGELIESHEPEMDPVILRFLRLREYLAATAELAETEVAALTGQRPLSQQSQNRIWRRLRALFSHDHQTHQQYSSAPVEPLFTLPGPVGGITRFLPGAEKLSAPEYIPTKLMQFFDVLNDYFPAHRLISCDFNQLQTEVEGVNAPVVQTRCDRQMVQVTTPLVHQGYFDILFPTNFRLAEAMYQAITGKLTNVVPQETFLTGWASTDKTRTQSGENPLLDWYKNASVLLTV